MSERIPCEFFLLRYVPDVVKGEFVNIGVVLRESSSPAPARVRFTRDWTRVRCIDANADLAMLEDLEQLILRTLSLNPTDRHSTEALLATLQDSVSNSVQISRPRASLAENLATEMELLMRLHVESMPAVKNVRSGRKATGRPAIFAAMRTEFERVHVWPLMSKRLAAERYTRKGDPLRLDCGYRYTNGAPTIRIFQAVSLDGDVEMAKVLAFTSARMREGVARVESATLRLTAVVEPLRLIAPDRGEPQSGEPSEASSEAEDRYHFGVSAMQDEAIDVITVNDLARAAATAQHHLGL